MKISKAIKWGKSWIRKLILKLKYGKRIVFNDKGSKPVYIGKNCEVTISPAGRIVFANGVYLDDYVTVQADDGIIEIAENVYFNTFGRIVAKKKINIGSNCIFGSNVSIYDHDHDVSQGVPYSLNHYLLDDVIIGDYIWCGTNVVITKGSIVKANSVVAANSVVTKKLESNGIFAGVPAKKIKDIAMIDK